MKRFVWVFVLSAACAMMTAHADALEEEEAYEGLSLNCGAVQNYNTAAQFGNDAWLEYIVETRRDVNLSCLYLSVRVDGYVVGVSGSAASDTDPFTASVRKQVPVPYYGEWQVNSEHYRIWLFLWAFHNGSKSTPVTVQQKADDEWTTTGDSTTSTESDEWTVSTSDPTNPGSASPIIIDIGHNGYRLTSVADGVLFDLNADGIAERVAWTDPDGDEEFLAFDANRNGRIDDGSELLGNYTRVYPGSNVTAANGFEALKMMEGPAFGVSRIDEVIDADDAIFGQLLLWRDANHNGISEPGELRRAADAGLRSIPTTYKTAGRRDQYGNQFRQRAPVVWSTGEFYVYDVWLRFE